MDPSQKISMLCEKWWNDLAYSKSVDLSTTGIDFLSLLGWEDVNRLEGSDTCESWLLRTKSGLQVGVHCLMPKMLESPAAVLESGLDFCETTLMLVGDALDDGFDYVLITDFQKFYLYDATSDDLLLHADSPHFFVRDMVEELIRESVEDGSLDRIRREPRSFMARQLRVWAHRTRKRLETVAPMDEDTAGRVIDRLILLRFLYEHPICEQEDWSLRYIVSGIACEAFETPDTLRGEALIKLFHDLHTRWGMDAFAPDRVVEQVFSDHELSVQLMRELTLLSKSKFDIASILESFNYGEAAEKARVRLVPERHEGRETFLATQRLEGLGEKHIEIDVLEEGYRVIGHWMDKLVAMHRRLEIEGDVGMEKRNTVAEEESLLNWAEHPTRGGVQVDDVFHRVLEKSFRIWVDSPRQLRTARLMLYLHLIQCYEESGMPLTLFPDVGSVCASRPTFLEIDREQIYQANTFSREWDVV